MSDIDWVTCDACGSEAPLRLVTSGTPDYPASRVFSCDSCGRLIWRKNDQRNAQPAADGARGQR